MTKPLPRKAVSRKRSTAKGTPRCTVRRLHGEPLETRQLLSVAAWSGEGESCGPVTAPGTGSSAVETSTPTAGGVSGPIYGPALPNLNPVVAQVDMSTAPVQTLTVRFSHDVAAAALIADGSIVAAVSLVNYLHGPVSLQANQFAYDPAAWRLTLTLSEPLPGGGLADGSYEVRIDGSKFQDAAGRLLCGGQAGLRFSLPTFAAPVTLQAAGSDLKVDGYSVPSLADWNGDGLLDLIVGEKTAAGEGKIRIYGNSGTNPVPVYNAFSYAQSSSGGDLSVSASGCLGVFPRVFDWNRDGRLDLVLGLANGTVLVALNENTAADPRFGVPSPVQVGPADAKTALDVGDRATIAIVDWNDDGSFDLVLGGLDGKVQVLLNATSAGLPDFPTGTLLLDGTTTLTVSSGRSSVAVADLNGDGRKDLLVGNTEGQLLFFANVGTEAAPRFAGSEFLKADDAAVDLAGSARSRPFVDDVNQDGISDLLVGAADGLVRLYVGSASPAAGSDATVGDPGGAYAYAFHVQPLENADPWQNTSHPLDVNNDGLITPLDALIVANYINANGSGTLAWPASAGSCPPPYLDCAGDGSVTPQDALLVINDLNLHGAHSVTAASGTDCAVTPVCTPAGEAGDLEDTLAVIASDAGEAATRRLRNGAA